MFTVTETIHHGQYRNVQSASADTLTEAVDKVVATSPYNVAMSRPKINALTAALAEHGSADHGWARYVLTADLRNEQSNDLHPTGEWFHLPSMTPHSPIDEDAGDIGGDVQAGPAYAISWRRRTDDDWETLTLYHFAADDDDATVPNARQGVRVETMIELVRHTDENDPGTTELDSDCRYESGITADPPGELDHDAALAKANEMAIRYTVDNLTTDPQTLWWPL
jgi:hypothetical protein